MVIIIDLLKKLPIIKLCCWCINKPNSI